MEREIVVYRSSNALPPALVRGVPQCAHWGGGSMKRGQLPQSPLCSGDSRLRAARSAALTVHRTVIHYRRLRFAYPLQSGGRDCAPAGRAGRKARHFIAP